MEALAVIWAPVRSLSRVAEERRVLLGFGVVALYAVIGLIGSGITALSGGFSQAQFQSAGQQPPPGFNDILLPAIGILTVIFAVIFPFVAWLLVSGLMQLVTRFFGGVGPFSGMLAVVGVALVPYVISSVIRIPLAGLGIALGPGSSAANILALINFLLGLAALLWSAALVVVGAAFARRIGYGESAGSCAISCVGIVGLVILVFIVIIAIIVATVGISNSGGTT